MLLVEYEYERKVPTDSITHDRDFVDMSDLSS